ncbi:MAG: radical SAM protein [Eubacterium sp.]|nr:radical SAM protein [Eubacterium sp.]
MTVKKTGINKFIEINFPWGVCNMQCAYCYVGQHDTKMKELNYSIEDIRKAFAKERLGGVCLVNLCSDGETMIHPDMPAIIEALLEEGHYVMVVTNGTMTNRLKECLALSSELLTRLFFKISFHYEEMKKSSMLDVFFDNVRMLKASPCSLTVEYIVCDETWDDAEQFKQICMEQLGTYPQMNMPRESRKHSLGICSVYSWENYVKKYEKLGVPSEFFDFRKQMFGKKYKKFCYAGQRSLWVSMGTGYSYQCYSLPPLQYFMDYRKPVRWLAIGEHCNVAHCYSNHAFMTLGVTPYPDDTKYCPTYDEIRNRRTVDGISWLKPDFQRIFKDGVKRRDSNEIEKSIINYLNILLKWYWRKYGEKILSKK